MNLEELLSKTLHPSWCNGNAQVHWSTFLHHPKLRRDIPVGQSLPSPLHYHHYNCCCSLINIHDSSSFLFKPEVFMTPKWPWMWDPQWLRHWEKLEIMLKSFISPLTSLYCRQLQKTNLSHSLQQGMTLCDDGVRRRLQGNLLKPRMKLLCSVCPGAESQPLMYRRTFLSSPKTPPIQPIPLLLSTLTRESLKM